MKQKLVFFASGVLAGGFVVYFLNIYVTANERTLGRTYPISVGLNIRMDIRTLSYLQSNEMGYATNHLKQRIDSNVNTLLALEKVMALDESTRKAMVDGQKVLKAP